MAVLAGLIDHTTRHPDDDALPALCELPAGWTGYGFEDTHALQRLHTHRVTLIDTSTPADATFVIQDGKVIDIRTDCARYTLTGGPCAAVQTLRHLTDQVTHGDPRHQAQRTQLASLVTDMELLTALLYADAALYVRYGHLPVPEDSREALAASIRQGREEGYTLGQLLHLLRRATATAVKRADETGQDAGVWVPVALADALAFARHDETPVPEHALPDWVNIPAALKPARTLLETINKARSNGEHHTHAPQNGT